MATIKTAQQLLAERNCKQPLDEALDQYEQWSNASQALAMMKNYEISNGAGSTRKITRANATEVQQMLKYWENKVAEAQGASTINPRFYEVQTK